MSLRDPDATQSDPHDQALASAERSQADERADFMRRAASVTPVLAVPGASGMTYLLPSGDGGETRRIFAKPGRSPAGARLVRTALRTLAELGETTEPGGVFVDIGADVGMTTLGATIQLGFSRAVCVESNPDRFALLCANLALNNVSDRAVTINAEPFEESRPTAWQRKDSWGHFRQLRGDTAQSVLDKGKGIEVRSAPLDDILAEHGIQIDHGLVHIGLRKGIPEMLAGASTLVPRLPAVLELDQALVDEELALGIGACYPKMASLEDKAELRLHPTADLPALVTAGQLAKDDKSVRLLLLAA